MHFYVSDPQPGVALSSITEHFDRIAAIVARAGIANQWGEEEATRFVGAYQMVAGMVYHHANHVSRLAILTPVFAAQRKWEQGFCAGTEQGRPPILDLPQYTTHALDHEAIAYLNRLGQFFKFAKDQGLDNWMPHASEIIIFRHKHGAHRSMDARQGESDEFHVSMATAFNFGFMSTGGGIPHNQVIFRGRAVEFCLVDDHRILVAEAAAVFQALFPTVG